MSEGKLRPADIARHWECSRAYVSSRIKLGCPTDSLEAADAWRLKNSKYGVGYRSKGASLRKDTPEQDVLPPSNSSPSEDVAAAELPETKDLQVSDSGDLSLLESSRQAAIHVEEEAYRLVTQAQALKEDDIIAVRIAAFSKAQSGRMACETAVLDLKEREKSLVPMEEAKDFFKRIMQPLLTRLRSLPRRAARLVSPSDAVHAEEVLTREIEDAIAENQEGLESVGICK